MAIIVRKMKTLRGPLVKYTSVALREWGRRGVTEGGRETASHRARGVPVKPTRRPA